MKKLMALSFLIAAAFIYGCGSQSSGKVLVEINGDEITEGDLQFLGEINPRIQAQIDSPAGQKRILDNLVEQEILYQEAVREGINRDPKVKAKVDLYRRVIIAQSLVESETDKMAKKYYDDHLDDYKKLKMSHIMVKFATPEEIKKAKKGEKRLTEQEALKKADELKARIDKGEAFEAVAKEFSDDSPTKARGGDLGLVSKDDKRLEARGFGPLLDKAVELKVGEVAGPIKTDKGYHIIIVTRGLELEPFDEVKQSILFKVRGDVRNDLLARLKKNAKIVYPEEEKAKAEAEKKKAKAEAAAKDEEKKAGAALEGAAEEVKEAAQEVKEAAKEVVEEKAKAAIEGAAKEIKETAEDVKKAAEEIKDEAGKDAKPVSPQKKTD